jgi:hypothetical protein
MGQDLHTENGLTAEGFKFYEAKAKLMSAEGLQFAIKDCHECIENGINENRYKDESSCYYQELEKRNKKKKPERPPLPTLVIAEDLRFYEDADGFTLCSGCANARRNHPFEKTRPVREVEKANAPCYWCDKVQP